MNARTITQTLLVSIVCITLSPVLSHATVISDTIQVAYKGVDAGGEEALRLDGSYLHGANGVQVMQTRNAVGSLAEKLPSTVWAYCTELGQYTDFPFNTYNVVDVNAEFGSVKGNLIRQLWAQHYDKTWETQTYIYYGGNQGGYTSGQPANTPENVKALAFQFALYEIRYDFDETSLSSLSLNAGRFQGDASGTNPSAAVSTAAAWLNSLLLPANYQGPLADLVALKNSSLQDLIVQVPEPTTLGLLALGGVMVTLRRKKD